MKHVFLLVRIVNHLVTLALQTLTLQARTVLKKAFLYNSHVNYVFVHNATVKNRKTNIDFNFKFNNKAGL